MNDPCKQTLKQYVKEAPITFWITFGVAFYCGCMSGLAGTGIADTLVEVFPWIDTVYYDLQPFRYGLTILSLVGFGGVSIGVALLCIHRLHCAWLDYNEKKQAGNTGKEEVK